MFWYLNPAFSYNYFDEIHYFYSVVKFKNFIFLKHLEGSYLNLEVYDIWIMV